MLELKLNTMDFIIGMSPIESQEFQSLKKELFLANGIANTEAQKDIEKVYRYNFLVKVRLELFTAMQN